MRFCDIDPEVFEEACGLKIIVTDVRGNAIRVLGTKETPLASVADAVVASAALPVIFRPPQIRGWAPEPSKRGEPVYVDGGLVSNLPVWAFQSEKKNLERVFDVPIPILALTLNADTDELPKTLSVWEWAGILASWVYFLPFKIIELFWGLFVRVPSFLSHAKDVLETGIFGSQTIAQDLIPDIRVIAMASPLKTTQFGCSRDEAISAYLAGREAAGNRLDGMAAEARADVALLTELLSSVRARLVTLRIKRNTSPSPNLRIHLVECAAGRDPRIALTVGGNDRDVDDRLGFGDRNTAVTKAFKDGVITVARYDGKPGSIQVGMSKYEKALLRKDRKSIVSIPVFDVPAEAEPTAKLHDRAVVRLVCIDSDDDLQPDIEDTTFSNWLVGETMVFQPNKEISGV